MNFDRVFRPHATTWRVYDGGDLTGRPLIARGMQTGQPLIVDAAKWGAIRKQIEELA